MSGLVNIFQAAPAPSSTFDLEKLKQNFSTQRATDWTIGEAFMCLLLSAATADGRLTQEEHTEITALAGRSRTLKQMSPQQMADANAVVGQRLATRPNGLEEACQSLPSDMRLSIFAHCVDVILSDGELHQAEADFLNKITAFMGIEQKEAERVMETLLIKNRF